MKKWKMEEVCVGYFGTGGGDTHIKTRVLLYQWDSFDGEILSGGIDPDTCDLYTIPKKGDDGDLWAIEVPKDEDDDFFIKEALAEYKKIRRRCEDQLRKQWCPNLALKMRDLLNI